LGIPLEDRTLYLDTLSPLNASNGWTSSPGYIFTG
jgi:hypothetical protein